MSAVPEFLPWYRIACPTCGSPAGHRCRTRRTGRVTDTHTARQEAPRPANVVDLDSRRAKR